MALDFKHSVFIAYHGSADINGTAEIAKSIKKLIDKNVPSCLSYCGPDTNERTYDDHPDLVIPVSKLFLFVVNDSIPKTNSGQINPETSQYIIDEIKAFKMLIDSNLRNKKDFAVLYTGNFLKNKNDITNYVKKLLYNIDPNEELYVGNHYYLVEFDSIIDWVDNRIKNTSSQAMVNEEYYPFKVLEKKVVYNIDNKDASFLIQMGKGMGKTTFVRGFSKKYSDKYFIFPYYITDNFDCSRENFYWSLVDFLRECKTTLPSCNINVDEEFIEFLRKVKKQFFSDKKMVFIIDGIDNIPPLENSLLSLFSNLNTLNDGICFIFTSKTYDEINSSSAFRFVSQFNGEKVLFNMDSPEYLSFLFDYFNDEIIGTFYRKGNENGLEIAKFFDKIEPKNILSFSIITKLIHVYYSKYKSISGELISSLSASMDFYYSYIKNEYNEVILGKIKRIFASIIVSALPLSIRDIVKLTGLDLPDDLFLEYPFLEIFLFKDENGKYSFVHEEMEKSISKDCKKEIDNILGVAYLEAKAIPTSVDSYYNYLKDSFVYIKTLSSLLLHLSEEEKKTLVGRLCSINFSYKWGKQPKLITKESYLLSILLRTNMLDSKSLVKVFGLLGFNYHLSNKYSTSRIYFEQAYDLYQKNNNLIEEDVNLYISLLTRYSSVLQEIHLFEQSQKLYKEAVALYDKQYEKGLVEYNSLVFNWICLSHVYSHAKNLKMQKQTLAYVDKRFGVTKRSGDLDNLAFFNFSLAYYYRDKKKYKKSLQVINQTIDYYKTIDYQKNSSAFLGNIMECFAIKASLLSYLKTSARDCLAFIHDTESFLNTAKNQCDFHNIDFDSRVNYSFAKLLFEHGMFEEAKKYASAIIYSISNMLDEERNNNIISNHEYNTQLLLNEIEKKEKNCNEQ